MDKTSRPGSFISLMFVGIIAIVLIFMQRHWKKKSEKERLWLVPDQPKKMSRTIVNCYVFLCLYIENAKLVMFYKTAKMNR